MSLEEATEATEVNKQTSQQFKSPRSSLAKARPKALQITDEMLHKSPKYGAKSKAKASPFMLDGPSQSPKVGPKIPLRRESPRMAPLLRDSPKFAAKHHPKAIRDFVGSPKVRK